MSDLPVAPSGLLGPAADHAAQVRLRAACEECRSSKTRCSGRLPCDRCERSNRTCVFKPALQAGRKAGEPKETPAPAACRTSIQHPRPRPPPDPGLVRGSIRVPDPPAVAKTVGELAYELEIHHLRELGAHLVRSPELRPADIFVVDQVEPGSAWQQLTLALITAATTDSPMPLAPLYRCASDPHTFAERPIPAPGQLAPLTPLPALSQDHLLAIYSGWCAASIAKLQPTGRRALTCPNAVILSPLLFLHDMQTGCLDRALCWMIVGRVLNVHEGIALTLCEKDRPELKLPVVPGDWYLFVAHAERDLHNRSIDDANVTTISALVLLSAVDMTGLRDRPVYGYGLAAAGMTMARREIARRLAQGWTRRESAELCREDLEMEMLINAAYMLAFLLAWHALDGRASSVFHLDDALAGLPLPSYATQLGALERTIGGATVARRHRDFCDACRVLQIVSSHDGDSRALATPRLVSPSYMSAFELIDDVRSTSLRPTSPNLASMLHRTAVQFIDASSTTSSGGSTVLPVVLAIFGIAKLADGAYMVEAAQLGLELAETLAMACEGARCPGEVDRHSVGALIQLIHYVLPLAFSALEHAEEMAGEMASARDLDRIERAAEALALLRDELHPGPVAPKSITVSPLSS